MKDHVLAIAASIVFALSSVCIGQTQPEEFGGLPPTDPSNTRQDERAAEVDLYKIDGSLTDRQKAIKKTHPEIFKTEAVVIIIGMVDCAPCWRQRVELRGPRDLYNILYFPVNEKVRGEDGEEKVVDTKHAKLAELWEIGNTYPTVVVAEKGVITKTFLGYTPWGQIRPYAEKAKKNEKTRFRIDIGPFHIWDDDKRPDNRRF